MKKKTEKQKKDIFPTSKREDKGNTLTKKELERLKEKYKKGELKFDSKDIAEAILDDFKEGMTN